MGRLLKYTAAATETEEVALEDGQVVKKGEVVEVDYVYAATLLRRPGGVRDWEPEPRKQEE